MRDAAGLALFCIRIPDDRLSIGFQDGAQLLLAAGCQETPVKITGDVRPAIFFHHLRCVLHGIEAQADEPDPRTGDWILQQLVLESFEYVGGQRATVGVGTTAVDETQDHHFVPHQLVQTCSVPIAVKHLAISGHTHGWKSVTSRLRCFKLQLCPTRRQYLGTWRFLLWVCKFAGVAKEQQAKTGEQNFRQPGVPVPGSRHLYRSATSGLDWPYKE